MPKKFSCDRYFSTPLRYSSEQRAQFLQLEQTLVREALAEFAEHQSTLVVDPHAWKPVAREGDLTVYKARYKIQSDNDWDVRMQQSLRRPGGSSTTITAKWPIPTLLVHGHVRGRLDDSMYGACVDADSGFRLRSALLDDNVDDSTILYTFEGATRDDPFRFAGLVWCVYSRQALGSPLMRRRDNVLFVAMGSVATTPTGDRVGYAVAHSVDVPELRPLTQYKIERAYSSVVTLKRQVDTDRIELFEKGFFTPRGDVPDFAVLPSVVRDMLRAGNATIDAALNKKLLWMMQDAVRQRRQSAVPKSEERTLDDPATPIECGGRCKTRLNVAARRGSCLICRKPVCANCRVDRKLTLEATADGVVQKTLGFCVRCVTVARTTSALTIASREAAERDAFAKAATMSFRSTRSHGLSNTVISSCSSDSTAVDFSASFRARPTADFSASFRATTTTTTTPRKSHVLWDPSASATS